MALVSTISASNANSYVSVSDADTYFAARYGADDWSALSPTQKESLLITATRIIDNLNFGGVKETAAQALEWPRLYVYDRRGDTIATTSYPVHLTNAVLEQALVLLNSDEVDATISSESVSMDGLSISKTYRNRSVLNENVENELKAIGDGAFYKRKPISLVR